jgi:hypothetical protein
MPNDFFEISVDRLPVSSDLEYEKYTPEKYQKMGHSLQEVQNLMDQGATGKEILANSNPNDFFGIGETYRQFYNPKSDGRVKLDFDSQGNVDYTNGRHRVEEARKQGISHIPAEVGALTPESLENIKTNFGSGRDLSKFNPRQEQAELDGESYFNKPTIEPSTTMSNEQPQKSFSNAESSRQDNIIPAKEPNFDNHRGQTIEQGQGERGSVPVAQSSDSTPRSQEQMAQGLLEKEDLNPKHREWLTNKYGNSDDASNSNPVGDRIRETDNLGDFTPELKQAQNTKNNLQGDYGQNSPSPSTESSEQAETPLGDRQRLDNLKQEKSGNTGTETKSQDDSQSDRDRLNDLYCQKPSDTPKHQEQTETNNDSQF